MYNIQEKNIHKILQCLLYFMLFQTPHFDNLRGTLTISDNNFTITKAQPDNFVYNLTTT